MLRTGLLHMCIHWSLDVDKLCHISIKISFKHGSPHKFLIADFRNPDFDQTEGKVRAAVYKKILCDKPIFLAACSSYDVKAFSL